MFWSLATCSVFHTLSKSDSLIFRQLSSCKHNLFLHQQHFRCPIYFLPTLPLLHLFLHQPGLIQLCLCFSWAVPVSFHAPLNVTFHRSYFFFNPFILYPAPFHAGSCYFSLYTQIVSAFEALSLFTDQWPNNDCSTRRLQIQIQILSCL